MIQLLSTILSINFRQHSIFFNFSRQRHFSRQLFSSIQFSTFVKIDFKFLIDYIRQFKFHFNNFKSSNFQLQKIDIFRFRRSFRFRLFKIDRSNFYNLFFLVDTKYKSIAISFCDNNVFDNNVFDNNCFCQVQFVCICRSKIESQFEFNFVLFSLSIFFCNHFFS